MNKTLRLHPVCKLVLILMLMAVGFPCWEGLRLLALCALVLFLLLLDPEEGQGLRILRMSLLSVLVFGVTLLIGNTVQISCGAALHLELMLLLSLFMLRTPISELLRGLQSCRIPDSLLLGFLIVFRFIGVLRRELGSIRQASAMLPAGRLSWPVKLYRCLIIPFVYRLFVLSDQLGASVNARDYGAAKRSQYRQNPVRAGDVLALVALAALGGGIVWMG